MNGLEALEIIWKNKPRVCASCGYTSCENCEKVLAKAQIEKELKDGEKYKKFFEIIKKKVDERRIVLENNFDNKFSLGGLELCDLTYGELATILECFDFENIKVVDGEIQISSIRS